MQQKITQRILKGTYDRGLTTDELAQKMGLDTFTLGKKLIGRSDWTVEDMLGIQEAIGLSDLDILLMFFGS